jgi:hypothetical protein
MTTADLGKNYSVSKESEVSTSGVSWGAIIAGAFAASALSLVLIALGAGLGFSAISPWSTTGASAAAIGVSAIIWLIITQWISAGLGGYLAGRLRTKWASIHSDEVHFRDTAHGFLAWAVGAVIGAALLSSAVSSLIGAGAHASVTAIAGVTQAASQSATAADPTAYFIDTLFRSDKPQTGTDDQAIRAEVTRIFAMGLGQGDIPQPDQAYLAKLVSARTGLSQADAEKRVSDIIAQAKAAATQALTKVKDAADVARKSSAAFAFGMCLSMLIGAFIASVAASIGGKRRDEAHLALGW